MTREEALEILDTIPTIGEQVDALEIAIEALEQVTGKLNNHDDSLLTADSEACKEQKSKLDLISREDAIEAIEIVDWYHQNQNKDMVHGANDDEHQAWYKAQDIYKALEAVPSADRPRGEWIETAQDYYEMVNKKGGGVNENTEYFSDDIACPNCLAKFSNIDNETERFNFCPNCGADMRGKETDES